MTASLQSGSSSANSLRVARSVSPTLSMLLKVRTEALTWVAAVRCLPPALPPAVRTAHLHYRLQQPLLGMLADEPGTPVGENAEVNALILRREAERIFPV